MAREVLSFSEECYPDVIAIIRAGLGRVTVSDDLREYLLAWCDEGEEYWNRQLNGDGDDDDHLVGDDPSSFGGITSTIHATKGRILFPLEEGVP